MLTLADWVIVFLSYWICAGSIVMAVYYYWPGEKKRWPFAYIIAPAMLVHGTYWGISATLTLVRGLA